MRINICNLQTTNGQHPSREHDGGMLYAGTLLTFYRKENLSAVTKVTAQRLIAF